MIRHMVHLRFPAGTPDATRAALYDGLRGLSDQIEGVLDFRSFANISPEVPVVRGFHDLFWFDFHDTRVRDAYLVHPAHQALAARLVAATEGGPDGVFVCDVDLG